MKYISIAELGRVVTGKTPPTNHSEYFGGEIPFITPSDIETYDKRYVEYTERTLTTQGASSIKGCLLPPKSICFVCIGSTIGKSCMTKCVSYTNQQINSIIPNQSCIGDYLFYLLKYIKGYFQSVGGGTGAGKGIVNKTLFQKTKVEIHNDLNVQQRIASILTAYDDLIENNNRRIKILEQMAENLYKEWFVRFRFPGREQTEFENGIPKGWKACKLREIIRIRYGKDHKDLEDGTIPVFGSGGVMRYGNRALYSGETVMIPRKGSLHNVTYYKGDLWTVDTMFYTEFKVPTCASYLYFTLSQFDLESLNKGASIPSLSTDILYNLKIVLPPQWLLTQFQQMIDVLNAQTEKLTQQNHNLTKQRDLLLPRLMSGKLEV